MTHTVVGQRMPRIAAPDKVTDYHLPTAADLLPSKTAIVEARPDYGPLGAKGVGESSITLGIAAVQKVIFDVIEVELHEVPFTSERVRTARRTKANGT